MVSRMKSLTIAVSLLALLVLATGCPPPPVQTGPEEPPRGGGRIHPPPEKTGSIGSPDDGALIDGVQLQAGPEFILLDPPNAWGTVEMVALLEAAAQEMRRAYPDTVPIVVGHISREGGGSLSPHKSHQSGRDVDVAFYHEDNKLIRGFKDMRQSGFDVAKNWFFIETLLEKGEVQMILMDWEIQKLMVEELSLFESQHKLRKIFQYPRSKDVRAGIVRHAPSHYHHFHIRIACPQNNWFCTD